jgi:hypothetical protein
MSSPCKRLNLRKEIGSLPKMNLYSITYKVRTSPFASLNTAVGPKGRWGQASMTVEAACTLPLFLIAMTAVLYLISAASLACSVSEGLQESGKKMALYAAVKGGKGSETGKTATKILSLAYAKNQINQRVRENVLARNLTDAGSKVELWRSRIMKEDEMIDLVAEYRMKFSGEFLKSAGIYTVQRARVRAWTGRQGDNRDGEAQEGKEEWVYVTVNGSVYHKDRECTHIRLSVHAVDRSAIPNLRNTGGGKYYPCEACRGSGKNVYITETGDRYHSSVTCKGLKRGVLRVRLSEVESWSPCSRCGG